MIYFVLFGLLLLRILYFNISEPVFHFGQEIKEVGEIVSIKAGQYGTRQVSVNRFTLTANESLELQVGNQISFSGKVVCPHNKICQRPWIYKPSVTLISSVSKNILLNASIYVRDRVVKIYSNNLKRDQANLISGVVIGNITLESNFKNKLANVGLTHVVAASGMNVTLVAAFVTWIVSSFRVNKSWVLIISAGILFFYSAVTGFAPPVSRALIMCLAVYTGRLAGRKSAGFWSLIWAAYLMLWVDPSLITNMSFLLSFASMIGQISVSNIHMSVPNLIQSFSEILIQTGAAIVFTFPIVMIGFSTFSLVSMVSNLLVLWTVEPLMLLGGLAGIVGFVSMELARIILIPAGVLLDYFLWIVKILSNEKFLFKFEGFNIWMGIGYYLVLAGAIYYFKTKKLYN